jgi:DNA-binding transcriptional ArsR family regulator
MKCGDGDEMISKQLVDNADMVAEFLSAIGNGKRLAIMCHLLSGELSVGEIAEKVELSQSALSQHLAKLRGMGLVETRRERQMIYYSCSSPNVQRVLLTLDDIFGVPASAPTMA